MDNKEAIIFLSEHIDTSNCKYGAELEESLFLVANAIRKQEEEKERIIKELRDTTKIVTDCYGFCHAVIPKEKAIEIVKRGGKE